MAGSGTQLPDQRKLRRLARALRFGEMYGRPASKADLSESLSPKVARAVEELREFHETLTGDSSPEKENHS